MTKKFGPERLPEISEADLQAYEATLGTDDYIPLHRRHDDRPAPAAPAKSPKPPADPEPRCDPNYLERLSNCGMMGLWGLLSPHSLEQVLAPGYLDNCRTLGLRRHDRIFATCGVKTTRFTTETEPEFADLVVADVDDTKRVTLALLR